MDTTSRLLNRAKFADDSAIRSLLAKHRERLWRMVTVRMDPGVGDVVDPSDVVRQALSEAGRQLPDYLENRSTPFYPWLRRIAWDRLVGLHIRALEPATGQTDQQGRPNRNANPANSATQPVQSSTQSPALDSTRSSEFAFIRDSSNDAATGEATGEATVGEPSLQLPEYSANTLAGRLMDGVLGADNRVAVKREVRQRVRRALQQLPRPYQELLAQRYLEHLTTAETAAVLEVSEDEVKAIHLRALQEMHRILSDGEQSEALEA